MATTLNTVTIMHRGVGGGGKALLDRRKGGHFAVCAVHGASHGPFFVFLTCLATQTITYARILCAYTHTRTHIQTRVYMESQDDGTIHNFSNCMAIPFRTDNATAAKTVIIKAHFRGIMGPRASHPSSLSLYRPLGFLDFLHISGLCLQGPSSSGFFPTLCPGLSIFATFDANCGEELYPWFSLDKNKDTHTSQNFILPNMVRIGNQ